MKLKANNKTETPKDTIVMVFTQDVVPRNSKQYEDMEEVKKDLLLLKKEQKK